jgi:hypothetical protein
MNNNNSTTPQTNFFHPYTLHTFHISADASLPLICDNDTNGTQNTLIRAANHSNHLCAELGAGIATFWIIGLICSFDLCHGNTVTVERNACECMNIICFYIVLRGTIRRRYKKIKFSANGILELFHLYYKMM